MIDKTKSNVYFIMKFFAICSVIYAHTVHVDTSSKLLQIITEFLVFFGTNGVAIFFILGGFFYHREKGDDKIFWKKKFFNIVIPWVIISSLTFIVRSISVESFIFIDYIKWILGFGSSYYFVTVFLIFLFIFKWFKDNTLILTVFALLNPLSLCLEYFGIWKFAEFYTPFLNIFNWIGYFSIGLLIKKYALDDVLLNKKFLVCFFALAQIFLFVLIFELIGDHYTYFNPIAYLYNIVCFVIIFYLSFLLRKIKCFAYIGINTFFIYLIHMPIVQFIIARLPNHWLINCFSGVMGVVIMALVVFVLDLILSFKFVCVAKRILGIKDGYEEIKRLY